MTLGTKTLLFGVHQVIIHPLLVTISWIRLYHSFPNWKELFCIFIHDWGYWGKPNLKNADGDTHPQLGANIAEKLLGSEWRDFILGHSSFYVVRNNIKASKLLAPDKYFHCLIPLWAYKILAVPTGEFRHYRDIKHCRQVADQSETDKEWYDKLRKVCMNKINNQYIIDIERLSQ